MLENVQTVEWEQWAAADFDSEYHWFESDLSLLGVSVIVIVIFWFKLNCRI